MPNLIAINFDLLVIVRTLFAILFRAVVLFAVFRSLLVVFRGLFAIFQTLFAVIHMLIAVLDFLSF